MTQDMDAVLNEVFANAGYSPRTRKKCTYPKAKEIAINSNAWREAVATKLLDGYGVYDIAIWLQCDSSHVRREVARLRKDGWLRKWWGRGE
jgi:hypothetical protein